jgi:hypothetical protein
MIRIGRHIAPTLLLLACVSSAKAQNAFKLPTRFNIGGSFTVSQPKEGLGQNIGTGFGANVGMVYNLMSSGLMGLRFDLSHVQYGHEKKSVPLSETIGSRVLVDVHTNNTITALSLAPELAKPSGPIRPYVNFGYSRLFFRTTSSVGVDDGSEEGSSFSTTNQKDGAGAWVYGGGLRWQLGHKGSPVTLDTGLRYFRGGFAAYLREGSIQDNPDGSITISPLMSRTPFMIYTVGVKFQIPYDSNKPCARFLC